MATTNNIAREKTRAKRVGGRAEQSRDVPGAASGVRATGCVLSSDDVDELSEALRGQRDEICRLLVELDACRNGFCLDEKVTTSALGTLALLNKMIGVTLEHAGARETSNEGTSDKPSAAAGGAS
jgi:hypothetical protein